jgi:predicted O-methyltransferase YrrM
LSDAHGKKVEFTYFINENNGLSNIINNDKWNGLPFQKDIITTSTIDHYGNKDIDLLKIDVEGAELMVLHGAEKMLSKKLIRFIQVEKADHIELTGHTFQDIVDYLKGFGYTPIETEDNENVIFTMEGFTQDWNKEFIKNTQGLKFDFALEIGSFEGLTSRYICDNLLNEGGRLICIDPLTDEYLSGHEDNHLFVGQYERFIRNTRNYPIELVRMKSEDAFLKPEFEHYRFDFIYIDGDHSENAVYKDGMHAFNLCKVGGHILFDDYEWREETKRGIDGVLKNIDGFYETIIKGYQVLIKKTGNVC